MNPDEAAAQRTSTEEQRPADGPVGVAGPDAVVVDRPPREPAGDEVVDAVLEQFDQVTGEPLDIHIEAAERARQELHTRLTNPGQA